MLFTLTTVDSTIDNFFSNVIVEPMKYNRQKSLDRYMELCGQNQDQSKPK